MNTTDQHMDDCLYENYRGHGVRFSYPGTWAISETRQSSEIMIQVDSGGTSFWSLTLLPGQPDPDDVIDAISAAFSEEYEELDFYPVPCRVNSSIEAIATSSRGCDIEFVALELVNSAFIRCFQTPRMTGVILYQGTDDDLTTTRDRLETITQSLSIEEDDSATDGGISSVDDSNALGEFDNDSIFPFGDDLDQDDTQLLDE